MSDKKDKQDKPPKGKGLLKMALFGLVVAGAGGGTVFGLMAAGVLPGNEVEAK